jgi:hypothetical protein
MIRGESGAWDWASIACPVFFPVRCLFLILHLFMFWYAGGARLWAETAETVQTNDDMAEATVRVLMGPKIRIATMPPVNVYLALVENGTPEEENYFTTNFQMELAGAGYEVVMTQDTSDFYITLSITRYEEDPPNELTVALFETRTGREIVTLSWSYTELSEMDTWNLYLITQLMANAPVNKILSGAELIGEAEGPWETNRAGDKEPHQAAF